MTTLVRTWTTTPNSVPTQTTLDAQGKDLVLARKALYLSAGWTVTASSNAVSAGATDYCLTAADFTWAAAGVAHSWVVLRSPAAFCGGGRYIYVLIDLSTGAANQNLATVTWSSSAFTGGSTTTAPTATAGTYRTFTNKQFTRTPVANSKYHAKFNTDGDVAFSVSHDGAGRFSFGTWALKLGNVRSGVLYPVHVLESYSDVVAGAFTVSLSANPSSAAMWNNDGTIVASTFGCANFWYGGSTEVMNNFGASGDFAGEYPDGPVLVGTALGIYGTLVDVALAPRGSTGGVIVYGTEEPGVGASTHEIMGDFWVPKVGGAASAL